MTKKDALKIEELCINVTPAVEDAFYAFREVNSKELDERLSSLPSDYVSGDEETDKLLDKYLHDLEISERASNRLNELPSDIREKAIVTAFQMYENIKKYGVACAEWCE